MGNAGSSDQRRSASKRLVELKATKRDAEAAVVSNAGKVSKEDVRKKKSKDKYVREIEKRLKEMYPTRNEFYAARCLSMAILRFVQRRREKKRQREQMERDALLVAAFWPRLQDGLRVVKQSRNGGSQAMRILWIDKTGWRLNITPAKYAREITEKGVFLLDVAGIRVGASTYAFRHSKALLDGSYTTTQCLSIIASERTIDIVCRSQIERDALVRDLEALLRSLRRKAERQSLGHFSIKIEPSTRSLFELAMAAHLRKRLLDGIPVTKYSRRGTSHNAVLYMCGGRICVASSFAKMLASLETLEDGAIAPWKQLPKGLWVFDVDEVRPGMYTAAFAVLVAKRPLQTHKLESLCFSLIGSECVLNLQVEAIAVRDELVRNLRILLGLFRNGDSSLRRALTE